MLLGFKKRFIQPIQIGTKVFTMRKPPKRTPKIGESLYMYSGLRTKHCVFISNKEKLISTQKVRIHIYKVSNYTELTIKVDGRLLKERELSEFVKYDGFIGRMDFVDFWIANTQVKKRKDHAVRIAAIVNLYHWTDLRF